MGPGDICKINSILHWGRLCLALESDDYLGRLAWWVFCEDGSVRKIDGIFLEALNEAG